MNLNSHIIVYGFCSREVLYYSTCISTDTGTLKGIVSLYIQPITANESTHVHTLDDVWGVANEVE